MSVTHKLLNADTLTGIIERITFHNPETGYCVVRIQAKGYKGRVTLIGTALNLHTGESIHAKGQWRHDPVHGKQFQASFLEIVAPSTLLSIEKYLGSGLIKGVGPHFAKQLVSTFKEKIFDIIEAEPEKLLCLKGIGRTRQQQLLTSWKEQKAMRDIMIFLQNYQINSALAVRIYKTYKNQAIQKIKENPYRLARDIYGIGFKTADILAQQMGVAQDSTLRAIAGLQQTMQKLSTEGHCAVPYSTLESETQKLLSIPSTIIQESIEQSIQDHHLIDTELAGQRIIALESLYRTEKTIATHLKRLLNDQLPPWSTALSQEKIESYLHSNKHIQLSNTQRKVLISALQAKVFILTGGPGVGKTTVVKSILKVLQHYAAIKIELCAPTGRAAKRLQETTQHPAKTIHRLLGFEPKRFGFKHNQYNPLDVDFLIIDESSMLDITLTQQLLKAIPSHAAVLFLGDSDQLPSVGPGRVLADLLETQCIPSATLSEVFRQAAHSHIIINAHRINQGEMPSLLTPTSLSDFYFIESHTPEDIQAKILELVKIRIPKRFHLDPTRDIQILTPMNRSALGTHVLNHLLQKTLNTNHTSKIEAFGNQFRVGDKVIQQVNNYDKEVFNGDIGYITIIDLEKEQVTIQFEEKAIQYAFSSLDEINLAYAMSIHKSQGSEYPAVIIPVIMQHYRMLARNLLYTAETRGKQLVILFGQKKALGIAVQTTQHHTRLTQLCKFIREKFESS
jgi:exodeoxyribonuclease V alpha subunit